MSIQPAALDVLAALSTVLPHWGQWYVFGAQAVVAYGVPRLSADVDVTLRLSPDEAERFAREMEAAGFSLRVTDPGFVRDTRVMPFVHVATAMPLDIVLAGSGLEDEFIARARETDVGGLRAAHRSGRSHHCEGPRRPAEGPRRRATSLARARPISMAGASDGCSRSSRKR